MDKFLPLLFKSFRDIYVYLFNGIFFLASITFLDIYYGDGVIYGLFRKIDSNIICAPHLCIPQHAKPKLAMIKLFFSKLKNI